VGHGGGQDEGGDALGVAGGGADGDRTAEGVALQGEGVQALGDGGGDELVGDLVEVEGAVARGVSPLPG
jgi:hypothetical protein